MTSDQIVTILIALIAACGATFITGIISRPKVKAEAQAATAGGQVAISGDAREWAKAFADRAAQADVRATRAEEKVAEVERRCDALDDKFRALVLYTQRLQREVVNLGGTPLPPPAILTEELS